MNYSHDALRDLALQKLRTGEGEPNTTRAGAYFAAAQVYATLAVAVAVLDAAEPYVPDA